jgi:Protein of unknown function (DUF2752)
VNRALRVTAGVFLLASLWYSSPPANPVFQLCGFHWLTGRPCPLCGLTRALSALAKGHWSEAIHFNALSPLGFVMLFGLFWSKSPVTRRLWTFGIAAFAGYGVYRLAA